MYLDHDAFQERALQWDKEEKKMIEQYRKTKEYLDQIEKEEKKLIEEGKKPDPSKWIPNAPKEQHASQIIPISDIDKLEKLFFDEYEKVLSKDDTKNKDFNRVAYEEGKKARYYFEYMKT